MHEALKPNTVKVVIDKNGDAMYFSRSVIPYQNANEIFLAGKKPHHIYKHIGVYAFR